MDPCNIHEIKDVLSRHGFHFSKAKGQNFLTQSWVPERIAREAGVDRDCGVLEVGPGVGPLTQWLCRLAGQVTALAQIAGPDPGIALYRYDSLFANRLWPTLAAQERTALAAVW